MQSDQLKRFDLDYPSISTASQAGIVPSTKPPHSIQVSDAATDITVSSSTADITKNTMVGATCPDVQQRYPFSKKDREKEVRSSA